MSVNSKMTAIADKIRALLGITGAMGLDAMAAHLDTEKANVTAALAAIAEKGVTVDSGSNSDDLASLIATIEAGNGGTSGGLSFGDFLKIDEIQTGSFVTTTEGNIKIDRPSIKHIPRLVIVYSEDDVDTIRGSDRTTLFTFAMSNAVDVRSSTESTFTIQIGSATTYDAVSTQRTTYGNYHNGYGFAGSAVYNAVGFLETSTQITLYPMNGSTSSSTKNYFAVGATYKYLIGYEVVA